MSTDVSRAQRRHQLYEDAHHVFSPDGADELMASLPPVDWGEFATKVDVGSLREHVDAQGTTLRGEMRELRAELQSGLTELRGEMASLRAHVDMEGTALRSDVRGAFVMIGAEVRAQIADVRGEITGVRAQITDVRGEITGVRAQITDVRGEITGVKGEIMKAANSTMRWTFSFQLAMTALLASIIIAMGR